MMPAPHIEISLGLAGHMDLMKAIQGLESKVTKKAINKACREAQKITLEKAKQLVPVKTGKLRKWLKIRAIPKKYLMRKYQLTKKEARAIGGIAVMTGAGTGQDYPYYGLFLEKGTKMRGHYQRFWKQKVSGGIKIARRRYDSDVIGDNKGALRLFSNQGQITPGQFAFLKPALYHKIPEKRQIMIKHLVEAIHSSKTPIKKR